MARRSGWWSAPGRGSGAETRQPKLGRGGVHQGAAEARADGTRQGAADGYQGSSRASGPWSPPAHRQPKLGRGANRGHGGRRHQRTSSRSSGRWSESAARWMAARARQPKLGHGGGRQQRGSSHGANLGRGIGHQGTRARRQTQRSGGQGAVRTSGRWRPPGRGGRRERTGSRSSGAVAPTRVRWRRQGAAQTSGRWSTCQRCKPRARWRDASAAAPGRGANLGPAAGITAQPQPRRGARAGGVHQRRGG
jgi:hypothetical protein